jgi:predicted dehydrogenase
MMLVPNRTSRRTFLKRAALAAGATQALEGACLFADEAPNAKLRTAVIGCGGRGDVSLEGALTENLVAIVDVDDRRLAAGAKKAAARGAQPRTFSDYRRMFDAMHKEIDAVFVATPDHHHAPASMLAIQHGKHVYCEKPLCHDVFEARALAQATRSHKVTTMMGNQGHCEEGYRLLCEYIWAGAIGDVLETHSWSGFVNGGAGPRPAAKPVPT